MLLSYSSRQAIVEKSSLEKLGFQIDPYIGCEHLCYYCYALSQAETDWSKEIKMHSHLIDRLKTELARIDPQPIYMGYHTDPYQPCEENQLQTRKILELLLSMKFSASILTKSDLIVRDMDLLCKMDHASASISVTFNDDLIHQIFEKNTIATSRRINGLIRLQQAGIQTSALICPIIPYITDPLPLIKKLAPYTNTIWIYGLSIRDCQAVYWQNVEKILTLNYPDIKEKVIEVIFSKEHSYWKTLRHEIEALQQKDRLDLRIHI